MVAGEPQLDSLDSALPYGSVLTALAAAQPDAVALVCDSAGGSVQYTRAELEAWANRLARAYAERGLVRGDFATLALANGAEFFAACLAIWKLGAVPNPVSHRLPAAERAAIIECANPRLVIGEGRYGERTTLPPDLDVRAYSAAPLPTLVAPCERAMTSGGSTGVPKLIVATNPALYDRQRASSLFSARNAVLVPGPLYHGAPFSSAWQGLFCGCKVVVMERFDARRCVELVQQHKVDRMMVVPTMLHRIWRLPPQQRERAALASLDYILTGGAPCPAWLMRAWIEWLGPDVMHEAFGSSERSGGTFITGREWLQHPGSVGRAAPGTQLKILDEEGAELPPGEMGEIFVLPAGGQGSTYRYVGAEARATADGWESVGDMGYLGDRRTDMVVCAGRNVYPAEVEAAIDLLPGVRSSAVIGLPDAEHGQRLHAIVDVAANNEGISAEAVRAHLAGQLVHYKIPTSIELVATLLRDDAGKMRRSALRAARMPGAAT